VDKLDGNLGARLNVGIIGCGRIADMHAPGYLRGGVPARIYAVCDVDRATAERRAKEWGAQRAFTDYRELLADPDVHAVEIITPHRLHRQMCLDACRAGKHVSVQKPMAMNVTECDEMIRAAREAKVKLKVFENFVFYPPYVKARALIRDGAIGEPLSIRIKLAAGRGGWKVPLAAWLWRLNEEVCGGGPTIFDDGYHKFSTAIFLLGAVERVHAWIDRTFAAIDAPAMISWAYKEGGRVGLIDATVSPSMTVRSKYYGADERVEITGTEGAIWVTRCTGKLLDEPPLQLYRKGQVTSFEDVRCDWLDSFIDSTRHFVLAIRDGTDPVLSGEKGKEVLQFTLAAIRSAKLGTFVRPDDIME
jgi:predicted dehydrogenase